MQPKVYVLKVVQDGLTSYYPVQLLNLDIGRDFSIELEKLVTLNADELNPISPKELELITKRIKNAKTVKELL